MKIYMDLALSHVVSLHMFEALCPFSQPYFTCCLYFQSRFQQKKTQASHVICIICHMMVT